MKKDLIDEQSEFFSFLEENVQITSWFLFFPQTVGAKKVIMIKMLKGIPPVSLL